MYSRAPAFERQGLASGLILVLQEHDGLALDVQPSGAERVPPDGACRVVGVHIGILKQAEQELLLENPSGASLTRASLNRRAATRSVMVLFG